MSNTIEADPLVEAARQAAHNAYCKYSGFRVGAALIDDNGRQFAGCNVENASLGLSICAERAVIFAAIAAGARKIRRMAVSCRSGDAESPSTLMPCGACRQVIAEFVTPDFMLLVDGVGTLTISELLPLPFQSRR